ncbi:lipase/thioesterase family protein [Metarhizium robertsii ARSEF 23]|nr:lipase/thioesterase family protein [Metarhizium robertsii ARSEF 23]KHO11071.1 lipase/thioesterase family protein [Metarhizium robertsii ARSEF 23]
MVLTAGCSQASTLTGSLSCWGRDAGKVRGGDAGVVVDEAYRGNRWVCGRGHGLGLYAVIATATNTSMLALAEDQEC